MNEFVEFEPITQDQKSADLRELFRGAIKLSLEMMLQVVKEMVGAGRYERLSNRKDSHNGTYLRRLLTSLGMVEVAVPRTRESGSAGEAIGSYRRRSEEIDEMIISAYVNGVSTRNVGRLMEDLSAAHDFRHYFAVEHYRETHDVYLVKEALGHATVSITEVYLAGLGASS